MQATLRAASFVQSLASSCAAKERNMLRRRCVPSPEPPHPQKSSNARYQTSNGQHNNLSARLGGCLPRSAGVEDTTSAGTGGQFGLPEPLSELTARIRAQ